MSLVPDRHECGRYAREQRQGWDEQLATVGEVAARVKPVAGSVLVFAQVRHLLPSASNAVLVHACMRWWHGIRHATWCQRKPLAGGLRLTGVW